jgi:hypothetical protein
LVLGGAATAPCTAAHTRRGRNCAACPGDRRDTCVQRTFASVSQSHHRTTSAASEWGRPTPPAAKLTENLVCAWMELKRSLSDIAGRGLFVVQVGLLYDDQAQTEALALVKDWTAEERGQLKLGVSIQGLNTPFRGGTVNDVAKQVLAISKVSARKGGGVCFV